MRSRQLTEDVQMEVMYMDVRVRRVSSIECVERVVYMWMYCKGGGTVWGMWMSVRKGVDRRMDDTT